jgi:Flp pilus assembly pilin Flp
VRQERGQTTVEYLFLLAIVAVIYALAFKTVLGPALKRVAATITQRIEAQFMSGDLHRLRLGR